jgi:hypothetical protein
VDDPDSVIDLLIYRAKSCVLRLWPWDSGGCS